MSIPDETLARWVAWPRPGSPGPWMRDGRVVGVGRYSWRSYAFIGCHEDLLADAALIALAPEMREALDELVARVRELEAPLRWLVDLKDGPRDEAYEREKVLAWQTARQALRGDA